MARSEVQQLHSTIFDRRAAQHRSSIAFANMPEYSHLHSNVLAACKQQHLQWQSVLAETPLGYLHRSCAGLTVGKDKLPRQTLAWLIEEYVHRHRVTIETLLNTIMRANGDIHASGLMWRTGREQKPCINLHVLPDDTLYRVYNTIPSHHRPVETPQEPREPREQKPRKINRFAGRRRDHFGRLIPLPKVKPLPAEEVQFTWAQCDCCDKWRRLFNTAEEDLPEQWKCADHPDGITCDTPEDVMDVEEQWDGKVRGNVLRFTFDKEGGASVQQVDPPMDGPCDWDDNSSSPTHEPMSSQAPSEAPHNEGGDEDDEDEALSEDFDLFGGEGMDEDTDV